MSALLSIQKDLQKFGFGTSPTGEEFMVYTELFTNDAYKVDRVREHLFKDPAPEATVIVDLGANRNWFLHLLEEKAELRAKGQNVHYFRVEPQPLTVSYKSGGPVRMYHINRAVVPDAEDRDQFMSFTYAVDYTALAGSSLIPQARVGSEVPPIVLNPKYAEYVMLLMKNVSAMTSEIHVEAIGPKRLFDRITAELARQNVTNFRTLVKIDCEYKELSTVSDVLTYISGNEQWKDFLLVAETGSGGTFDATHRTTFAVEEYLGKTGMPDDWIFQVPYMLVQPPAQA